MIWLNALMEAWSGGETMRAAMLLYAAMFTVCACGIAGLRIHLFVEDRYLKPGRRRLPADIGVWIGLVAGILTTAFSDFQA